GGHDARHQPSQPGRHVGLPAVQERTRRRDGDAAGDPEQRALEEQHAAEGDDGGRDLEEGHQRSLRRAQDRAEDQHGEEGDAEGPLALRGGHGGQAAPRISPARAPTERSIWPATMTRTIPTARMAVTDVWRASSDRFRGRRKVPSVVSKKTTQMATRAPTMSSDRHGTATFQRGSPTATGGRAAGTS